MPAPRCLTEDCPRRAEAYSLRCKRCKLLGLARPDDVPRRRAAANGRVKAKKTPAKEQRQYGWSLYPHAISADAALLACGLQHEHIVGRAQMHLEGTPCPWCGSALRVVRRGWEETAA